MHMKKWKISVLGLTQTDSGCYKCWRWWDYLWKVEVVPEKDPSVVIGKVGGSAVMSCAFGNEFSMSSSYEKYWCREDQDGKCTKLDLNDGIFHIQDSKGSFSLEKRDLSFEDSGTYQCVVQSLRSNKSHAVDLQVISNQKDPSSPLAIKVIPGQQIKFACQYTQENLNAYKYWQCNSQSYCYGEGIDDQTRSEFVFSVHESRLISGNIYDCTVANSAGYVNSISMTLMIESTAPQHVNETKGGTVTIHCDPAVQCLYMSWCKKDSNGGCNYDSGQQYIKKQSNYFIVKMENLKINDTGSYRCGCTYEQNGDWKLITAAVKLSVTDLPKSAVSAVTKETTHLTKTTLSTKIHTTTGGTTFRAHPLLYGIICLLVFIAITLLIILLKLYSKRCKGRAQSPDLGGGMFYRNDTQNNSHLMCSTPQQTYGVDMDDSSSTSSESSGHSFGNISFGPQHQYVTIIPTPMDADYENVSEVPASAPDYENVITDKDQDYVNITEPQNSASTEGNDKEDGRPSGKWEEDTSSGESSSSCDESDEESVNYTKVVFKKATE
ncbi:polymeric immunoglobulin receptor-like isoform X2 [Hoplias malabaricus]|uniref:polymeric immunoglobulin receptor-like isoform X2 n=1 Tax=Hoplias malabaricus TaxID=27720 RepID=UPI0034619CED